jgi:2-methylcitrate dehydratase PrpD
MTGASLTHGLLGLLERPISPDDRRRAAMHLLDWIACAQLGSTAAAGRALAQLALQSAPGPCTTWGAGRREAGMAALVNGGLGNLFEVDDLHRRAIVHPGDTVIPAALAAAEREGSSGLALLDALIKGYEVTIRIGMAAGAAHYRHWYSTATCGVFGAAAACAHLLGLNSQRSLDALGQAGMMSAGLWQCRSEPTDSKQLATGRSAQSGLLAADLARIGFAGPRLILEGEHGFFAAACGPVDLQVVLEQPDAHWRMHEVSFKPWPACRHVHPVIEAVIGLRDQVGASTPIESIDVHTYADAISFADRVTPRTDHEARFSLQHAAAVAWTRGDVSLRDSHGDVREDPSIAALRSKVRLHRDADLTAVYPERYGATVHLRGAGGVQHTVTVHTAKGDPENPLSASQIQDKALRLMTAGGLSPSTSEQIAQSCLALAEGQPLSNLCAALVQAQII